jgi:hypothetical protein
VSSGPSLPIKVLPARHGLVWLLQSLALIKSQAARLLFLALVLQLILGLSRLPVLGIFIIMAVPALSAGFLQAFREVAAGRRPTVVVLFAPLSFGPRTGRLLALGALMFMVGILSVSLVLSGSGNLLDANLLARIEQGDVDAVAQLDPAVISRIMLAVAVGVALSGTLSFLAIPLLWFRDQKLGTALVSSLRAMFLNWKPYTVLALGLFALLIPVATVVAILFQIAGGSGNLLLVLLGLIMVLALTFQLTVFGTQYCSFRDIYGLDSAGSKTGQDGDSGHQLLA